MFSQTGHMAIILGRASAEANNKPTGKQTIDNLFCISDILDTHSYEFSTCLHKFEIILYN